MKKRGMLFVTNFHFQKDGNGGHQRTYFLIKELALHFDLSVISPYTHQSPAVKDIDAQFIENKGVKAQKKLQTTIIGRVIAKFYSIVAKVSNQPNDFVRNYSLGQLQKQIDTFGKNSNHNNTRMIVFDTRRTVVPLDRTRWDTRILNAHNFDFEIIEQRLSQLLQQPQTDLSELQMHKNEMLHIKQFEFDIDTHFDEIWTCSESDIEKFKFHNPNTSVNFECLPNGSDTDTRTMQPMSHNYKHLLFVGSLNYFPNIEGLQWFVDTVFSKLPSDYTLNIVGKSPDPQDFRFLESYTNIHLIGEVDDVAPYYEAHDAVIVPILEGSGTRLKILEAFSYGKLVLSTPKGIEGIMATDGEHYIEFENYHDFDIKFLQKSNSLTFETIRKESRQFVEDYYSWKHIVSDYSQKIYDLNYG
ncbi:glycosyltransferase family 4 protein [Subsaxibacter sp. CAU 1640]|uniref:glycosyltransferase n=1 Tax=Subsaxibacter sp. CAU 1640 TaxID=2933271 RepID=UPI002003A1BF|nr:glycosyltransferase [Subsaxibacter sp. CAU 1640]MCK7590236.1 glycosyltransferase family 4 protein [Subsaxibacter sp. CAU 1640]